MVVGLYVVYDKKSKLAGPIFQSQTADAAKRMVIASFHETSVLVQFPDDYTLVHVADFDQIDATIEFVDPKFICHIRDLIPEKFRRFDLTGGVSDETSVQGASEKGATIV